MIIVTHDGEQKKFSILTNPTATLSVRDTNLKVTDKLSDIFPVEKIIASASSTQITEQAAGEGAKTTQPAVVAAAEPAKPPQKTWKANIDAGLTVQSGNTDATTVTLKGGYANERKKDNIYFDTLALYQEKDNDLVANEQRSTGKYEYKHTPRLYSFFNQYFEHDELEHLNYRSISSPGAGYRFIDKELMKYKAEAGPAYTYERYWLNPGPDHDTRDSMGVRVGQYFDWQMFPTTKFYAKNEFVQSVENKEDWWVNSGVGLRQALRKQCHLISIGLIYTTTHRGRKTKGTIQQSLVL